MFFQETDTMTIEFGFETQKESIDMSKKDINFIVLAVDSSTFGIDKKSYQIDVCGKPMIEWVENACFKAPTIKRVPLKFDLLAEVKPLLDDSQWTVVLFSDTPLITRKTVESAFAVAESKGLNVLKLTRGYVFNTEYVSRVEEVFGVETYYLEEEDFIVAANFKQLSLVRDIMRRRICDFFMKNGVDIVDPNSTFIDGNATIERNTVVMPFNRFVGKVKIEEGCVIGSNNVLEDCVIGKNSKVERAVVKNSVLGESVRVEDAYLEDSLVLGEDSIVVKTALTKVNAKGRLVAKDARLQSVKTEGAVKVRPNALVLAKNGVVRFFGNNVVGVGASILEPVAIGENVCIKDFQSVKEDIPAIKI